MIKYLVKYFPLIAILALSFVNDSRAAERISIAYLKEGLAELNKSEKLIALQMWSDDYASSHNSTAEIFGIDSFTQLMKEMELHKVDFVLLNTGMFLEQYEKLKPYMASEIYAIQRTEDLYEDYIIIVKNSSSLKTLADLNHKRFSFTGEHVLFNHYLEYLTFHANGQKPNKFFKLIRESPTASQSVLDVFFGSSDACLVPRHIYNMAAALNPGILRELTIIHSSGPIFIPAVLLSLNHTPEATRQEFGQFLTETHNSVRGRQIFDLFKIMRIIQVNLDQFQPMFKFYE